MKTAVEEMNPLPSEVRAHFLSCRSSECRAAFQEYELLELAIPFWKDSLPSFDFTEIAYSEELVELSSPDGIVSSSRFSEVTRGRQDVQRSPMLAIATVVGALSLCLLLLIQVNPGSVEERGAVAVQTTNELTTSGAAILEEAEFEAELKEFGNAYGSLMHDATNRLTDTFSVVLLEERATSEVKKSWFSKMTEQIEEPFESTLEFLLDDTAPENDEQSIFSTPDQNEYFGFLWSKSESLKPLLTLIFV